MGKMSMKNQFNDKMSRRKQQILQFDSMKDGKFRNPAGMSSKAWKEMQRREQEALAKKQQTREIARKYLTLFCNTDRNAIISHQFLQDAAWAFAVHRADNEELMLECLEPCWDFMKQFYEPQVTSNGETWTATSYYQGEGESKHYKKTLNAVLMKYGELKEQLELDRLEAQGFLGDLMSL